jgi:hypothetical protein
LKFIDVEKYATTVAGAHACTVSRSCACSFFSKPWGQAIAALNKTERIILSAAAVLLAAYFRQPVFLLVAAGAGYRVFSKDIPATPSHAVTVYYLMVLAALGYLIDLAPTPPSGS